MLSAAALIAVASRIGRRWGPAAGGLFVALPLISGPIMLTFALERGSEFARQACLGSLLAILSMAAFALSYAWSARRASWIVCSALACLVFLAGTYTLQLLPAPSLAWAFVLACVVLGVALLAMPSGRSARAPRPAPVWDIPLRMTLAAALVVALSTTSAFFGARVSGLLTPFPATSLILVSFTQHDGGAAAASQYLRGLLKGLFSFSVFMLVVGALITSWTIGATFLVATIVTLIFHAGVWRWMRMAPTVVTSP
jgi:hypothetical protein